jgi:hypothetical protein
MMIQAMLFGKEDFFLTRSRWSLEHTENTERTFIFGLIR